MASNDQPKKTINPLEPAKPPAPVLTQRPATGHSTANRQTPKRLGFAEVIKASDWLHAHREELYRDRPTHAEVARRMETDLGFPVSANSIRDLREATKINWPPPERQSTGAARDAREFRKVATEAILELYAQLGLPEPAPLAEYYRHRVQRRNQVRDRRGEG